MSLHMSTDQEYMSNSDIDNEQTRPFSTYASFGDGGVTATTNSYGHLLQITSHLGNESSGLFCVDLPDMPPAHLVTPRMQKLQDRFGSPDAGMKLHVEDSEDSNAKLWRAETAPELKFVHDRWPRFDTETPIFNLSVQYLVFERTVYQIYKFKLRQGKILPSKLPPLVFNANLLLRDLTFIASSHKNNGNMRDENTQGSYHEEYSNYLSHSKDCIIRSRVIYRAGHENHDPVVLSITPFINKNRQQLSPGSKRGDYQIIPEPTVLESLGEDGLEITLAYRLAFIASGRPELMPPVSPESFANEQAMLETPLETPVFTQDHRLNLKLRRNLEHILSVCCIPIACDANAVSDNLSIALTCGDLSGHRISTSASFPGLLNQSFFNASLQIIKVAQFCRVAARDEETKFLANDIRSIVKDWVKALHEKDKGRHFAFPNPRKGMAQWVFNLSDHAIIWWAAKAMEELGLGEELQVTDASSLNISQPVTLYSSENIQTKILKKFTIQPPLFEQSMIAVSRSCSETRFQFRAKDTVLFYAMDLGLFDQYDLTEDESSAWQNKVEAWTSTVDYQKESEKEQNANWNWDQPLCIALALISSSKNKRMNSRTISEIQQGGREILLQSSSSNGLFPGQLDENRRPVRFESEANLDSFWSATFELPYVLLKYPLPQPLVEGSGLSVTAITPSPRFTSASPPTSLTASAAPEFTQELIKTGKTSTPCSGSLTRWESPLMKHGVLFTNAIDHEKIVEIPDEWLYNEPRFFSFRTPLSLKIIDEFYKQIREMHNENLNHTEAPSMTNIKRGLQKEVKEKKSSKTSKNAIRRNDNGLYAMKVLHEAAMATYKAREGEPMGHIIDVPRVRRCKEMNEYHSIQISSSAFLLAHINKERTPTIAKKRIFHFCRASWNIAAICYLASSERDEISCFFDRHASLSPYFFEDTIGTLNKWVTELHLSFHQILSPEKSSHLIRSILDPERRDTIPKPKLIQFPHSGPKGAQRVTKCLSRAVISLRFDGDLLDRYWTRHLIEYRPQQTEDPKEILFDIPSQPVSGALKYNSWRQRRVLELLLFDKAVREMLRCTGEILEEAKGILRAAKDIGESNWGHHTAGSHPKFSENTHIQIMKASRDGLLSNNSLYKIQEVLQEVEDDLGENLAKMQLWKRRQDRGLDRPRWTLKDEYRYGGAISRLQASNDFYMEELVRCRAKILAFNSQLTREIDAAAVTGRCALLITLATGIFSMSETPSAPMIYRVVVTAVVALFLTVIALINAKDLERMLQYVRHTIRHFRHQLSHLTDASKQFTVDKMEHFSETILESAFSTIIAVLDMLNMMYRPPDEPRLLMQTVTAPPTSGVLHSAYREVIYYYIYHISRYLYYPLRRYLLTALPGANIEDPVSESSLGNIPPIKQARADFEKSSDAARVPDRRFEHLFDNIGRRKTGNLFKIWQENLKAKRGTAHLHDWEEYHFALINSEISPS
ncbi:uncharacterized protein TRIVIDRAFT_205377 [Trichoderma virens Gv29-8]|uniref:Uncharacterized protein n=1 Tax=Hypocrea virens (strain Gv29-8 / FGSC 10586) TaxID=413071 RepID=G9N675_HYPVG|nr:uncharacterized protein TRIVIDRAFT_205377 [Trichoderma virens Gv29-8]EHK17637.1 hypothetical protein TRIVIDRAFT_205377 [Trichoderma virens Gv29-8]